MRPVNLLPPELRHGTRAPMRTGPIPYIIVGALAAVLAGVALLVMTGNQISERKSEVAQLKREDAVAVVEAKRLTPYVQFQALHSQRVATISSLADSRFDWERVMQELALILPHDVWLTEMNASASSESEAGEGGGGGGNLRGSVPGPALVLAGCATGQESVAGFVTALKDIDGVTRVAVELSELPNQEEGEGSTEGSEGDEAECRTRHFIAKFNLVIAFDAAPIPVTAEGEGEEIVAAAEGPEADSSESESTASESSEGE
jgi:Tfp pilus assembly protein PilN